MIHEFQLSTSISFPFQINSAPPPLGASAQFMLTTQLILSLGGGRFSSGSAQRYRCSGAFRSVQLGSTFLLTSFSSILDHPCSRDAPVPTVQEHSTPSSSLPVVSRFSSHPPRFSFSHFLIFSFLLSRYVLIFSLCPHFLIVFSHFLVILSPRVHISSLLILFLFS